MAETTAQKTARLRALRYARDGSPDERKAAAKAQAEYRQKMQAAAFDHFVSKLHAAAVRKDHNTVDALLGLKK